MDNITAIPKQIKIYTVYPKSLIIEASLLCFIVIFLMQKKKITYSKLFIKEYLKLYQVNKLKWQNIFTVGTSLAT
jgi:hypothetical protein